MAMSSPRPDIDERPDVLRVDCVHEIDHGIGQIVDEQEFAPRRAGTPDFDAGELLPLGFVKLVDQRGDDMRFLRLEVIAIAIKIARHQVDKIGAVFVVGIFAQFHRRDLGDGIALIGRLEGAGEDIVFLHRLRAVARIDARAAQIKQLAHAGAARGVDAVQRDHHVFVEEFHRIGDAGADAADMAGEMEDEVDFVLGKIAIDRRLIAQIELARRRRQQICVAVAAQPRDQRAADHAARAGDQDLRLLVHGVDDDCHSRPRFKEAVHDANGGIDLFLGDARDADPSRCRNP